MSTGSVLARTAAKKVIQPSTAAATLTTVDKVLANIKDAAKKFDKKPPRLVAVSKTHNLEKVQWAYQQGLRHFGENYIQELHEKATQIQECSRLYNDIRWHYIGHVQRNKLNKLIDCPRLWMVETLHKIKTAKALDAGWGMRNGPSADSDNKDDSLKVLIEVNTSKKQDKLGCLPEEVCDLASYIVEECKHLELCGLMTTGTVLNPTMPSITCSSSLDFTTLLQCRDVLSSHLPWQHSLELSMGVSADYQQAIEMGSTSVRVGTAVFGPRKTPSARDSSHQPL